MNRQNWFYYDPINQQNEFFDTQEEAIQAARDAIPDCLTCEEWDEEVENIFVGFVTHRTVEIPTKDEDGISFCDYGLKVI